MKTFAQWEMQNGGLLGSPVNYHRKFRYTLELSHNNTNIVRLMFVKVNARPQLKTEETEIDFLNNRQWIAGKTTWNDLDVTAYGTSNDPNLIGLSKLSCVQAMTGNLRLYDGCGYELESWELKNMFCKSLVTNFDLTGDCDIDMKFCYSDAKYTNNTTHVGMQCPPISFNRKTLIEKAKVYAPHLDFT